MNKSNVVLIGMPGAGKSTIGVVLAKVLKKPFVDTDLLIQQKEGRYLQDIIATEGLDGFLRIEADVVKSFDVYDHVIATGGSVVYSEAAMHHLKKDGTVIYLKHKFGVIKKRLWNLSKRGVAMKPGQGLHELYRERTPLYESYADIIISCTGMPIEDIIADIKEKLEC